MKRINLFGKEYCVFTTEEVNKITWEVCAAKSQIDTAVTEMDELHHVGCYFDRMKFLEKYLRYGEESIKKIYDMLP